MLNFAGCNGCTIRVRKITIINNSKQAMKKLSLNFLFMLGLMASLFFACNGEDDTPVAPALPTITSISPSSGEVTDTITINGTNLASATVSFGTVGATVLSPTATSLQAIVPQLAPDDYDVVATVNGNAATSATKFTVTPPATAAQSIAAIAQGNNNLSVLVAALQKAELVATLDGTTEYTVFAPTNDAFTAAGIVPANVSKEDLTAVLQNHVVAGVLRAADLKNGDRLTTLSGKILPVTVNGTTVTVGGATVSTPNVEASNGVVHVVDAVLQPETPVIAVTDADLVAGQTYNWTADNEYLLTGLVYLEAGGVLNIAAGTTVRFTAAAGGDNTSALIITQGAQINAVGTPAAPIVFTAEADVEGANLLPTDWEKWGGLILLGEAPASKDGVTADIAIEGISSTETRGVYGGTNPADNSGTLQYVSIRYTGVGIAANSEIQGLTLGGVGSGTTIDHIDIYSSNDDGIEIFGGTVNISYISVAFATDDAFDFDEGWRGSGQFLFGLQLSQAYDHVGEWDGAVPDDAALYSAPNLYNATLIGPGQDATGASRALIMRDAFAGKLGNSILEDFPGVGIQVEDIEGDVDSYARLQTATADGYQIEIVNNTWARFGGYVEAEGLASLVQATVVIDDKDTDDTADDETTFNGVTTATVAELNENNNNYSATPVLTSINRALGSKGLDPRPAAATAAAATVPTGLTQVPYRGAFAPGEATWLAGWSTLSKVGILTE